MHEQDVRFQGFGQRQIRRIAVEGVAQYEPGGIGWFRRGDHVAESDTAPVRVHS